MDAIALDPRLGRPARNFLDRGGKLLIDGNCGFRRKSATDSGMKSATDSDLMSAIPI